MSDAPSTLAARIAMLGTQLDRDIARLVAEVERSRAALREATDRLAEARERARWRRLQDQLDDLARRVEALETAGRDG